MSFMFVFINIDLKKVSYLIQIINVCEFIEISEFGFSQRCFYMFSTHLVYIFRCYFHISVTMIFRTYGEKSFV